MNARERKRGNVVRVSDTKALKQRERVVDIQSLGAMAKGKNEVMGQA